jgi:hypothetical protein
VSDEVEELTPALFDHAKRLYEEMLKASHKEESYDKDPESEQAKVEGVQVTMVDIYEGHLTRLFSDLGLPNPYYTKILDVLKSQNCITQLRRGGGKGLSRWCMHTPPTEEGFKKLTERRRPTKGKQAELEQRVKDLTHLSNELYERIETLTESFEKLEADLAELGEK